MVKETSSLFSKKVWSMIATANVTHQTVTFGNTREVLLWQVDFLLLKSKNSAC